MKTKPEFINLKPLTNIKRQGGWTFWSLTFTLSVIAFFSFIGMQLVPIYSANANIQNAMELSVEGADLRTIGRAAIIRDMNKQLYLDGTNELLDYKEDLDVKRSRDKFTLQVTYERRFQVVGNINVMVSFDPIVECDLSGSCSKK